jgi:hypothetical protein
MMQEKTMTLKELISILKTKSLNVDEESKRIAISMSVIMKNSDTLSCAIALGFVVNEFMKSIKHGTPNELNLKELYHTIISNALNERV